jgi:hypothetical protein
MMQPAGATVHRIEPRNPIIRSASPNGLTGEGGPSSRTMTVPVT